MADQPKKSDEELRRLIFEELDLRDIVAAARRARRWSAEKAKEADHWYRRFLFLCAQDSDGPSLPLSTLADMLWHQHILDTRRYAEDCQRIFGFYLHHKTLPQRPGPREHAMVDQMLVRYRDSFGEEPPEPRAGCDWDDHWRGRHRRR